MEWIAAPLSERRGSIEMYQDFRQRNVHWWRLNRRGESRTRRPYYERFLDQLHIRAFLDGSQSLAEVGPGPFGGMIEVCSLRAAHKTFVDYILPDLVDLHFIHWPEEGTYVHAGVENIPLPDNAVDILLSYNCLDHGWNVYAALLECIRISRHCFLAFDCRGDDPHEVQNRQAQRDLDHFQLLPFPEVERFVQEVGDLRGYQVDVQPWYIHKTWATAVVVVHKEGKES